MPSERIRNGKPGMSIEEAEKLLGTMVAWILQMNWKDLEDLARKGPPIEMRNGEPILRIVDSQIENAYAVLEGCGVPRERSKTLANGIMVLMSRVDKEQDALRNGPGYAARKFIKGEISLGKLGEQLGLNSEEIHQLKNRCHQTDVYQD